MKISPMRALTTLFAVAALAVAGCGGGSNNSSSGSSNGSSQTLSKADFQKQANAICKGVNDKVNALDTPTGFEDVGPYADKVIAITDDAVSKLKALKPPSDLQDDWNSWLGYADGLHTTAQELKDAAAKKDQAALKAAGEEASARDKKSDPIAKRLGLDTCAQS
jgi:hypothetical protein